MTKKATAKRSTARATKKPAANPKKKSSPSARGLTEAQFKKIALAFPGTSEGTSYGMPSILLLNKFFTRLRKDDNSLVLHAGSIDEREMLLEADPATFHITDHYKDYPGVLARLDKLDAGTLKAMLERRWRVVVPKKMLKEHDGVEK